jgi:two-component system response regulator CpxR
MRLEINGVILDSGSREVYKDGEKVEMTTLEFDILEVLMRAAGRALSRDALTEHLCHRKATAFDRSIDMHISHLRRKLETDRAIFKTVRGVGYQFCRTTDEVNG